MHPVELLSGGDALTGSGDDHGPGVTRRCRGQHIGVLSHPIERHLVGCLRRLSAGEQAHADHLGRIVTFGGDEVVADEPGISWSRGTNDASTSLAAASTSGTFTYSRTAAYVGVSVDPSDPHAARPRPRPQAGKRDSNHCCQPSDLHGSLPRAKASYWTSERRKTSTRENRNR